MKVETTRFGEIEVEEDNVLNFLVGPYGFEEEKEFVLWSEEETPFFWMQSINSPDLAFVVSEPWAFYEEYEFDISEQLEEKLALKSQDEVLVFNIIVIPENPKEMTMNLKSPIVINKKERLAKQIILEEEDYPVRYRLFNDQDNVSA